MCANSQLMAALSNMGGALCLMPQSLADARYQRTRNPLKLAGLPITRQQILAVSGPKFTILWGRVGEILLFNRFFPIVNECLSCEDIALQSCAMVRR